ncbi:unnamed protein product, partial [Effrenium voratum]
LYDFVPFYGNARHYANMLNEDFIGRLKPPDSIDFPSVLRAPSLARKILIHGHPTTISRRALAHYCVSVTLRWEGDNALRQ